MKRETPEAITLKMAIDALRTLYEAANLADAEGPDDEPINDLPASAASSGCGAIKDALAALGRPGDVEFFATNGEWPEL